MQANPTAARFSSVIAVTGILFCVYYFLLVPHLEAPLPKTPASQNTISPIKSRSPYARFFSEDSWERTTDSENLLKSDNIVMLFQNFRINDEMKISSDKCTILIAPGEKIFPTKEIPGKPFHPIIISIMEGADIQLSSEEGENFSPRPVEGRLHGPVTIKHKTKVQNHFLDCSLTTSDLICDMNTLQTQKPVNFSFGTITGEGSHLTVFLEINEEKKSPFSGIQSIRLNQLKHITLGLTPFQLKQIAPKISDNTRKQLDQMFGPKGLIPIILTCDGPVTYDVSSGSISFSRNVTIKCQYENMPHDSISCEYLTLQLSPEIREHFQENQKQESLFPMENRQVTAESLLTPQLFNSPVHSSDTKTVTLAKPSINEKNFEKIPLERVSARTNIQLNVPTFQCSAKADNLEFHFPTQTLKLESNLQAEIRFAREGVQNEFYAKNITYVLPVTNKLGTINVTGSGWFRTSFEDPPKSGQFIPLRVNWREQMTSENGPENHCLIRIVGEVQIESPPLGNLTADSVQLLLRPKTERDIALREKIIADIQKINPQTKIRKTFEKMDYLPEILNASGNIRLNFHQESVNLQAELNQIQFRFQPAEKFPEVLCESLRDSSKTAAPSSPPEMAAPNSAIQTGSILAPPHSEPPRNFVLAADSLSGEILMLPGKDSFFVSKATLLEKPGKNITIHEESSSLTSEQKIKVEAQKITLHDIHRKSLQGVIQGTPTVLSGMGMRMETASISLNCAANRIDINHPGKMKVYFRKKNTLSETNISWQKNLFFDGQKIQVNGDVQVRETSTEIHAEKVLALLSEPIMLNKPPKISKNTQVSAFFSNFSAEKNIFISHRLFDENSALTDIFSIRSGHLNFDPYSKTLTAEGKGQLRLSHFGSFEKKEERTSPLTAIRTPPARSKPEWRQMLLEYSGGINANLTNGEFSIREHIAGITYPVRDENDLIPKVRMESQDIPPNGFTFTCSTIFINQVPSIPDNSSALFLEKRNYGEMKLEFLAEGKIHVEDSNHSIDGHSLQYSQEKNQCTIKGTPHMPVRITQQEFVGGPRNEMQAGTIKINLETMEFSSDEIMLDGAF